MILSKPRYRVEWHPVQDNLLVIEAAARTCYKSEPKGDTRTERGKFIRRLVKNGHLSVIEHSVLSVRFIIDRGVSHELVRHRLCAFSQESTRYCDYKGGVEFIIPLWLPYIAPGEYDDLEVISKFSQHPTAMELWMSSMARASDAYRSLRMAEWPAQQARSVLPNSLKTEIVTTANYREWRHIFSLRDAITAHPQMQEIMLGLHEEMKMTVPEIFES